MKDELICTGVGDSDTKNSIWVDFDIAVKLKENGFKQDNLFFYEFDTFNNIMNTLFRHGGDLNNEQYSAPTAEEIILPYDIFIDKCMYIESGIYELCQSGNSIWYERDIGGMLTIKKENEVTVAQFINTKECNRKAEMWLYLKKEKLIK